MSRKPIQICETPEIPNQALCYTTALCDDGSIWRLGGGSVKWERLPDVPQDETGSAYTPQFSNGDLARIMDLLDERRCSIR